MPGKGKPFQKGHKLSKGGARVNSGRKPDWFREKMRAIATNEAALQFLEETVLGKDVDEFITQQGECIPHRAKAETRLKAWEAAADRGFGKPTQAIEHTGANGGPIRLEDLVAGSKKDGDE